MADKKYVVSDHLVYLKVPDAAGALVSYTFYRGAPVPENVDPDSLQHHLDGGQVIEASDPVAEVLAVPAGTPIPGEPPNVPVTESSPLSVAADQKVEEVRKAMESGRKSSSKSESKQEQQENK